MPDSVTDRDMQETLNIWCCKYADIEKSASSTGQSIVFSRRIKFIFMLTLLFTEKPAPPSQPEIREITSDRATIHWQAPKTDGGAPVSNYRIEKRESGAYRWDMVNPTDRVTDTSYTVTGLQDETDYEFRVSAENKAGLSMPSTVSRSAKYGKTYSSWGK